MTSSNEKNNLNHSNNNNNNNNIKNININNNNVNNEKNNLAFTVTFSNDVFILDVVSEVFVWFSKEANDELKRKSFELATVRFLILFFIFILF